MNSSRFHLRNINAEFAAGVTPDMYVLDAGAGTQPYRDLFDHAHYESADFEQVDKSYAPSTYVCELTDIPAESNRFDRVILNQVLEHLPDPLAALTELHRVMKPGGVILCTSPLFYAEHEVPYDFYRYTQFGMRHLFTSAGFEVDDVSWMEGYLGTVSYQLRMMARDLPVVPPPRARRPLPQLLLWPLVPIAKLIGLALFPVFDRLDRVVKLTDTGMPKNYVVVATASG